jgi:hypothetical protein
MFGLLCHDDLDVVGHSLFNNFRLALYNHFGRQNFIDILDSDDLNHVSHFFIVDEHFTSHASFWKSEKVQKIVNGRNIRVIVFNFERIFDSYFPWNVDHQKTLGQFRNYYQFVSDVDDAKILNKSVINKQFLSRSTVFPVEPKKQKIDKVLFIGQLQGNQYENRRNVIDEFLKRGISLDVVASDRKLSYADFLGKVNDYKYILNPLGTGKFINLRHFEALYLGTIPIQQISADMVKMNQDICDRCITFMGYNGITEKINNFKYSSQPYYLEDYFKHIELDKYL